MVTRNKNHWLEETPFWGYSTPEQIETSGIIPFELIGKYKAKDLFFVLEYFMPIKKKYSERTSTKIWKKLADQGGAECYEEKIHGKIKQRYRPAKHILEIFHKAFAYRDECAQRLRKELGNV